MSAAEMHLELCAVYGQNIMSERTVRQWCTVFKDERTSIQDEERTGHPSVLSNDLFQSERGRFTISDLPREFAQISRTFHYEIITD
jgi:hypothetical protein